jgi:YHS domain-containing protein
MKTVILVTMVVGLFVVNNVNAQTALRTKNFNTEKGLAIQGYDPISYFISGKDIEGNKSISVTIEGITYYFSSQKNKDLFLKDPKKFEPQYGGWCAYAMGALGEKVEVDPETFKIYDGKLYLFFHSWTNNTLPKWNADEKNLRPKAEKYWSTINK